MFRAELDAIDMRILKELQADGRMTNVELAARAGISAPPCLRRVRKLEEAGIIEGYTALLNAPSLGYDLVAGSSRGYSGPGGFPEEARAQFVEALRRVTENPEFLEKAKASAMNIDFIGGDDYTALLKKQEGEYREIWADIKDEVQAK